MPAESGVPPGKLEESEHAGSGRRDRDRSWYPEVALSEPARASIVAPVAQLGAMTGFMSRALGAMRRRPFPVRETIDAMAAVGLQTLLPVLAVMTAVGMIGALQGLAILRDFGADGLLSGLLAQSILRELSPSLTAIMVAAQAGTAIAGELGTMRVKEEIDALGVMAVDPLQLLVVPRLIALTVMCPLLNLLASLAAMGGGYLVAVVLQGMNSGVFVGNLLAYVNMAVIVTGLVKAAAFGLLTGTIACYYGYNVTGGAQGVGRAANNTVVHGIVAIAAVNYFLTSFLVKVLG